MHRAPRRSCPAGAAWQGGAGVARGLQYVRWGCGILPIQHQSPASACMPRRSVATRFSLLGVTSRTLLMTRAGMKKDGQVGKQAGKAAERGTGDRFRARDGFGLAGMILLLVAALAVLLLVMGLWKRFARETAPTLVNLPGGSWTIGGALGLISVLGVFGALRCSAASPAGTRLPRVLRAVATAACCAAAFGPFFYLLGALPGKNCRSYDMSCSYLPGTGSAFSGIRRQCRRGGVVPLPLGRREGRGEGGAGAGTAAEASEEGQGEEPGGTQA